MDIVDIIDMCCAGTMGATRVPMYMDSMGKRVSTEYVLSRSVSSHRLTISRSAYLTTSVLARPNLKVVTGAQVTKIRIVNNRAVGVEFATSRGGEGRFVGARKEVLLS